jgi:aquaporin Z
LQQWQKYLAELTGTFILMLVGSASILAAARSGAPVLVVVPFGFGLAFLAAFYAFGEVSGGHYNPAVSLAMFLDRRITPIDLIGYWIAQIVGGVLGSAGIWLAFGSTDAVADTVTGFDNTRTAFFVELLLTAIFVMVFLAATKSGWHAPALLAVPLTLVAVHFGAIPFSGASVNPARSLGPALIGTEWGGLWLYFVAPPAGACLGWLIHSLIVKGDTNLRGDAASKDSERSGDARGGRSR